MGRASREKCERRRCHAQGRKFGLTIHDAALPPRARVSPFAPPDAPREVTCIHCERSYNSDELVWDRHTGMWWCPFLDCDGAGYGCDVHTTDQARADAEDLEIARLEGHDV